MKFLIFIISINFLHCNEYDVIPFEYNYKGIKKGYFDIIYDESIYISLNNLYDMLNIYYEFQENSLSGYIGSNKNSFKHDISKWDKSEFLIYKDQLFVKDEKIQKLIDISIKADFSNLKLIINSEYKFPYDYKRLRQKREIIVDENKILTPDTTILQKDRTSDLQNQYQFNLSYSDELNFNFLDNIGTSIFGIGTILNFNFNNNINNKVDLPEIKLFKNYKLLDKNHNINFQKYKFRMFEDELYTLSLSSIFNNQRFISFESIQFNSNFGNEIEVYENSNLIGYYISDSTGITNIEVPLNKGLNNYTIKEYTNDGRFSERNLIMNTHSKLLSRKEYDYDLKISEAYNNLVMQGILNYGLFDKTNVGIDFNLLNKKLNLGFLLKSSFYNTNIFLNYNSYKDKYFTINSVFKSFKINGSYNFNSINKNENINLQINGELFSDYNWEIIERVINYEENSKFYSNLNINAKKYKISAGFILEQDLVSNESQKYILFKYNFQNLIKIQNFSPSIQLAYNLDNKNLFDLTLNNRVKFKLTKKNYIDLNINYEFMKSKLNFDFIFTIDLFNNISNINYKYFNNNHNTFINVGSTLSYNSTDSEIDFTKSTNVDKSSFKVRLFLDLNKNNIKDSNEIWINPKAVSILNSNKIEKNDTSIYIKNLEPYMEYSLEINEEKFDNPLLVVKNKIISIQTEPSQISDIRIPVYIGGILEGKATIKNRLIPNVELEIINLDNKRVHKIRTFSDGSFYITGLIEGNYQIKYPDELLIKNNMEPFSMNFNILSSNTTNLLFDYK